MSFTRHTSYRAVYCSCGFIRLQFYYGELEMENVHTDSYI